MKFRFGKEASPGWLAIRQRGAEIDIAHVVRGGDRPRVSFCETYRGAGVPDDALAGLRREKNLRGYRCTALLARDEYEFNMIEAPNVPLAERAGAARWRIKDLIDYPLENAAIDVLDIPVEDGARSQAMFAVSARNEIISGYVRRFQDVSMGLAAIDIPEAAQRNVSALFEEPDRGLAFLAFEETGGLLTVTFRGELYLSRRIDVSLARLIGGDAVERAQLHERIALEIQRSLDHFDRQYSFITLSRFLLAPLPAETELAEYLAGNIYVRVERADLASVFDCDAVPEMAEPALQACCLQVLGAGLRDEAPAK
jgi:MSHA biogenesis protein MshI